MPDLSGNEREDYAPSWSPDGKTLTYVTVTAEEKVMWYATNHLATIPATGGTPTLLTQELDRNVSHPKFSPDGSSIWFVLEDSGENQLVSIATSGANLKRAILGEVSVSGFQVQEMIGRTWISLIVALVSSFMADFPGRQAIDSQRRVVC